MSDLTMTARFKLVEPPRLFQIQEVIRKTLVEVVSLGAEEDDLENAAIAVFNELLDRHLIGLPSGNAARTSVDCSLVAQLGEKLACRKGDDADDVLRTAIRVGVIVG